MKIKKFENKPQKGDYVICKDNHQKIINNFTENNIGLCIKIDEKYLIQYKNIPDILLPFFTYNNCRSMFLNEIIYFSSNKEDCEFYLLTKKYNI